MSMQYIRDYYKVPAKRGGRVEFEDKPGVITGSRGPSVRVRLDGETESLPYHPTWHMKYLDEKAA